MRINYKQLLVVASAGAFTFAACGKDDDKPSVKPNSVVAVADLVGDTAYNPNPTAAKATVYFSFKTNGKVTTGTNLTTWDVSFSALYNSDITPSNGKIAIVDTAFAALTTAPDDAAFTAASVGMTGAAPGWYTYNPTSHTIGRTKTDRTLVLKTADGKYAKFEMISIYKGNPAAPTVQTPLPYLTFNYYVQADGSKNLSTK